MSNATIAFDSSDLEGMRKIMAQYGDTEFPFYGKNEDGESISISVFPDRIVTVTEQANGWVRKNTFYSDGSRDETFDGTWTEPEEMGTSQWHHSKGRK